MNIINLLAGIALVSSAAVAHSNPAQAQAQAEAAADVTVPPATLLSYAGSYTTDRGPEAVIALGLDGSLTIQLNSQPLAMRPVSQTEFAVDEKRAGIIFKTADGKVSGSKLRQGNRELNATRVK